jgi:hypothetical protein
MRHSLHASVLAGFLLTVPLSAPAWAVSVEELFNLKANGLSDDVLVALIESDGSVFRLTPEDVLTLHKRGLAEKVILAMIASAKGASRAPAAGSDVNAPRPPADATAPAVIHQSIIQHVEAPAVGSRVVVEVPVAVPVPIAIPVPVHRRPVEPHMSKPVYWGFGGQPRPGTWQPVRDREPEPATASRGPATPRR